MTAHRAPRAFTLIEVIISLAISIGIIALCTGLTASAMQDAKRSRVRAELARDAAFLDESLRTDLLTLGLGVPVGRNVTSTGYGTGGTTTFYASVLIAAPEQLGFLGDLPRPDAQMSPFGALPNRALGGRDRIWWHNDSNGTCLPDTGGPGTPCDTADTSVLFPGESGCTTSASDRVCPWSMKRLAMASAATAEPFQIVAGDGTWVHARPLVPATLATSSPPAGEPIISALKTDAPWDAVWPNTLNSDMPTNVRGQGFVTTLDRVFYFRDGTKIRRVQCWGDPDPGHANWPEATAASLPSTDPAVLPGLLRAVAPIAGAYEECTPAEVVARNVARLSFTYFDGTGNQVVPPVATGVGKAGVRRIAYEVVLSKPDARGRLVEETLAASIAVRN